MRRVGGVAAERCVQRQRYAGGEKGAGGAGVCPRMNSMKRRLFTSWHFEVENEAGESAPGAASRHMPWHQPDLSRREMV